MNSRQGALDLVVNVFKYVLIILLIFFLVRESRNAYRLGYSIFNPVPMAADGEGKDVQVTVAEDESLGTLAAVLESDGLIENKYVFRVQEYFSPYHDKIQPGTYTLNTGMLPNEMLEIMAADAENADAADSGAAAAETTAGTAASDTSGETSSADGGETTDAQDEAAEDQGGAAAGE